MSAHSIILDDKHFSAASQRANALGKSLEEYLQALIDADGIDEILAPARQAFAESGMSEDQLSDFLEDAKRRHREERRKLGMTSDPIKSV